MSIEVNKKTIEVNGKSIEINESPNVNCWKLIYDNNDQILAMFESTGYTSTINNLFCGTEQECKDFIESSGLTPSQQYIDLQKQLQTPERKRSNNH